MKIEFARRQMVEQQLRTADVTNPSVLAALSNLRREHFVPPEYRQLAFADTQIPLPHGQVMMTPMVEGRVLQELDLQPHHTVLEIGTGTGFLTACLATLSAEVLSIDIFDDFVAMARSNLEDAGIQNIELVCMDATKELPNSRFDAVAVTGSLPVFDPRFLAVSKPGGRLFVIVGSPPVMEACIVTRTGEEEHVVRRLFETSILPLLNVPMPSGFSF